METKNLLEALLFIAGEPIKEKDAQKYLSCSKSGLEAAIADLIENLRSRGIRLMRNDSMLTLVTAPEASLVVEMITKDHLEGELSRSALETLAVILWKGKISRSGIDYIRGVNSTFSLRTLLVRGLVEREQDSRDARIFIYRPTLDLMKFLGITSTKDLPDFEMLRERMKEYD